MNRARTLQWVSVYEITHWYGLQRRGIFLRLGLFKKPDAKLEKGLRGFRAIAMMVSSLQMVCGGSGGLSYDAGSPGPSVVGRVAQKVLWGPKR